MSIVNQSRQAYNNRDLEAFLACYDKDIQVYILESNQHLTSGIEQLKTTMQSAFTAQPQSKTTLLSRIEQGNLIIDQEKITGHIDGKTITSLSIYEVKDKLISKLWFGGRQVT